jgi:hypothetical protein
LSLLRIPPEEVEVSEELDLLIVGGGAAGIAAAISGARRGLRTALVEEMPFLGGMSTGGCVGTFCGFYTREPEGSLSALVGGLPLQIVETLLARGHALGPIPYEDSGVLPYVPWGVKILFEELVRAEPGLRVMLHAKLTHALVEHGEIRGVVVQTRAGRTALRARVYVDASGDAELSRLAGAEIRLGEEIQYPSMMFTMQNVDTGAAFASLAELPRILEKHFESDGLPPVNATDAEELTWAEMEGRSQAARLSEFLRREVAGFSEAFLADSAARLGVRETRRIVGEYALSEDDVLGSRKFEDGIARSAWPIERHVRGGETHWRFLERGSWYTIPYRSLVPRGVDNLLVAGRCLSADAGAFGSARVIGPCMLEGQAVAVAAGLIRDADTKAVSVDVDRLRADLAALGVPL